MSDPATIRQHAIDAAEAAEDELYESLTSDGDCWLIAMAKTAEAIPEHPRLREIWTLAVRAGLLRQIVRRNAMRSDNAL